ncbi:MAG: hypothetical protein CL609_23125 [Anaerolineaceae bacterium]|nr:hypothetical protein [Anaerolineaceae bacterium]
MKLIDRYVNEVGDILPDETRKDIENEIRSLIEDRLMDRCEEEGAAEPTEEMVKEILAEMGPPEKTAKGYLPEVYLIGPRYFFIFKKVMTIVAVAQLIAVAVLFIVRLVMESASTGLTAAVTVGVLLETLAILGQGLVTSFAIVVLIFAAIEWSQRKMDVQLKFWTPQTLNEPAPEKISRVGKIFEIIFILLALTVFNIYPEWVGISNQVNGEWRHLPVLTENFWRFLPLLNIAWSASLVLAMYLSVRGIWEPWSKWLDIGIKIFEMVILFFLISSGPLVGVPPQGWNELGWGQEAIAALQNNVFPITNISIQVGLGVALVVSGVEVLRRIFKMTRGVPIIEIKP